MSALALFAAQRGIETGLGIKSAFDAQAAARQQSFAIGQQMEEIEARTRMQIKEIYRTADKVVANQTAQFVSAGVRMSGSSMSVISDTLNAAAQAAYIRQREADYDLIGLAMNKSAADHAASDESALLNIGGAMLGGISGAMMDKYQYGRALTKDRGASGIGGGGPARGGVDAAGGTTAYSSAYLNM